ncbi:MAG: hypothetical protein IT429_22290 [Gemmataceae bacterium]|nr:hypothetical protein [Gemmataceae bacterium]
MHTPFLQIEIRRKRDALLARRQARQVASLLGFGVREQVCVAGLTFELVCQELARVGRVVLTFALEQGQLLILPSDGGARVEKPLPPRDPAVAPDDLSWVIQELTALNPLDLFEEVQRQNQELLRVLLELQTLEERLAQTPQAGPTAA